jgi:riboflavin synthase
MFTGIIEAIAKLEKIEKEGSNLHFWFSSPFVNELKIDQSVSHNGVCLTVVDIKNQEYKVTAIDETLSKTNLGLLLPGNFVNTERCMQWGGRLDGHIVQGHVDLTGTCIGIAEKEGSWIFEFTYDAKSEHQTVPKGSVCVNGVSLTVVDSKEAYFTVAIIPYTFEHTVFKYMRESDKVNLEFDIIGKYVQRYFEAYNKK